MLTLALVFAIANAGTRHLTRYLPTFGNTDSKFRNVITSMLNKTTDSTMPALADGSKDGESAGCRTTECTKRRLTMSALKVCRTQARRSKSRRGVKVLKQSVVIPALNGTVAIIYHRVTSGYPDPEAWWMHCPYVLHNDTDTSSGPMWVAVKRKLLPVSTTPIPYAWVGTEGEQDNGHGVESGTCDGDGC